MRISRISDVAVTKEVAEFLANLSISPRHSLCCFLEEIREGRGLYRLVELPDTDGVWEVQMKEDSFVHYVFGFWAPDGITKKLMLCAGGSYAVHNVRNMPRTIFTDITKVELFKRDYFQNGSL